MAKSYPNFSLIIPNFNGSNFLIDCLSSIIIAIKQCPSSKFEIIIVDNGSTDNSLSLIKTFFKKNKQQNLQTTNYKLRSKFYCEVVVNYGIKHSRYNYVVLINNDLTIKSDWFKIISKSIFQNHNPKIASFFGTILNKTGEKYESQGLIFFPSGKCLNISNGKNFLPSAKPALAKLIWAGSGALVVYQKNIIQKIGYFDSDFFAYLEDVDIAFRLNKFGYQTLYLPQAISYHLGGGTSHLMNNFRYRMDVRNWFYFITKNYSTPEILANLFSIILERFRNLSCLIKKTINIYGIKSIYVLPRDITQIYSEVFKNFFKMRQKYFQIQKLLKSTK